MANLDGDPNGTFRMWMGGCRIGGRCINWCKPAAGQNAIVDLNRKEGSKLVSKIKAVFVKNRSEVLN